jgi:hypothetical protein
MIIGAWITRCRIAVSFAGWGIVDSITGWGMVVSFTG